MKPKNTEDYSQCVKVLSDGTVKVFCVECDGWHNVAILSRCNVKYSQHFSPRILDRDQDTYVCARCNEDVGYLLDGVQVTVRE